MVRILKLVLCCSVFMSSCSVFAQNYEGQTSGRGPGPRKQIATIIFAGLAGGVLGLSTLSFYGRPQDKLANVPMGVGIGVIIGAIYTTYKAATEPREFMDVGDNNGRSLRFEPEAWQLATTMVHSQAPSVSAGWGWSF